MQRFIPLTLVLALMSLFLVMMLRDRDPREIKSVMIDRPAPVYSLPSLYDEGQLVSSTALQSGKPVLVNFFASWCVPCRAEHGSLMKLAAEYKIPIIGIAYKDDPAASRRFIESLGNPYTEVGVDRDGRTGIDWGVTGVPETFLIDGQGMVRYRHWGPILDDGLGAKLLPEIRRVS